MTMISNMAMTRCDAVVDALRAELGAVQAERILEAEAADFLWGARIKERYLGQHLDVGFGQDEEVLELARVAIVSLLDGRWHAAVCLVDGDGNAADLLWKRDFDCCWRALMEFERAD